ncbi:MAG: phosphatidylinositol-specific phospholipase C1-like protein [Acidimicrobiales bacterium]
MHRRRTHLGFLTVILVALGLVAVGTAGCATVDDIVRLNEVQVIGSHNSYHLVASPEESELRRSFIGDAEDQLLYNHAPLKRQFADQKVRQIELDLFADAQGGLYASPLLRNATGGGPYDPAMDEPGTKVLHVQDVDYRSNCLSLVACLRAVKQWSNANPTHLPIAVLLELKDEPLDIGDFPFVVPEPFDVAALANVDAEIRGVFPEDRIISPDDIRGSRATLEEAVLRDGWPSLRESRGKVLFLMDNGGDYRTRYLTGHPNLEGRPIFTNAAPGQADAAFVKMNDAKSDGDEIRALVAAGYVVRTRADADTLEARAEDTSTRDAALASGAQWVSTDYPVRRYARAFGSDYVAEIPGGTVARCNPVNAPRGCQNNAALDTIDD